MKTEVSLFRLNNKMRRKINVDLNGCQIRNNSPNISWNNRQDTDTQKAPNLDGRKDKNSKQHIKLT